MTHILVIDDDRQLLRALRIALTARDYAVTLAQDGTTGLAAAQRTPPDLTIVDLGLPDMDGVAVVQALRGWATAPIIVLSARHTEQAKIDALDAGADDYVTKPFGVGELLARIRAALRRATPTEQAPVIATAAFTVDLGTKRVTLADGTEARLTPTEWHLLEILVRNPDRLITQKYLLQEIWGPRYERETNYLRVHMGNLRRKLEPDPSQPRYLRTDPGLGYRFMPDE
ncbi:DNA-binding response regulator [Micromonospora globispora]|uniref:DNA-binding response regulator n=1 Tax=Micromonospora globispora TaxID=1450148 RepID=A0A317K9V7_9ACTN|nr:response regulator [Micromonospora globispora]PWU47951.1 DNA-binding response regulator [Micromonospora globispora]PWU59191.1 DNA-binding response regulator [Micromonospora globispora]RQX01710.1 DNA-binding response regulator [Micromonospora globispora]